LQQQQDLHQPEAPHIGSGWPGPVHTGDYSRRLQRQFVAVIGDLAILGDSLWIRRQSPFSTTVAEIGDYSLQCGQGFRATDLQSSGMGLTPHSVDTK